MGPSDFPHEIVGTGPNDKRLNSNPITIPYEMATLTIRISDDLKTRLQAEADKRELAISDIAREKIKRGLGLPA